ncbi:MAG: copper-binding protein [Burkholderiales bacterium]|nr:copper-binding protein [Burkholderiales bacterium]
MTAFDKFSVLAVLVIATGGVMAARYVSQAATPMRAQPVDTAVASSAPWTRGLVKQIDADAGRITIQHEAIDSLGMPGMTMVFRAAHATLLDQATVGQAIGFHAERIDGDFVVTGLQAL